MHSAYRDRNLDIHFVGFVPEIQTECVILDSLQRLKERCPYDSNLKVYLIDYHDRYVAEIFVHHQTGKFCSFGEEATLTEALEAATTGIHRRLNLWRLSRFSEPAVQDEGIRELEVLVVDDDAISVRLLEACFREFGCKMTAAETGERALEWIQRKTFDLLIMDWKMPRLNGQQTVEALDRVVGRQFSKQSSRKIPVVTYSICERGRILFPVTKSLFQLGHLSKMASYKTLQRLAWGYLRRVRAHTFQPLKAVQ